MSNVCEGSCWHKKTSFINNLENLRNHVSIIYLAKYQAKVPNLFRLHWLYLSDQLCEQSKVTALN